MKKIRELIEKIQDRLLIKRCEKYCKNFDFVGYIRYLDKYRRD